MILEAGLLVATALLAEHRVARYLAAASCGLQNGLATHWGGAMGHRAVTRTTHVTGLFTDVGLLVGRLLSALASSCGKPEAKERAEAADDMSMLSVLGCIAAAYLLGIVLGTQCYDAVGNFAFFIPAAAVGTVGCVCFSYRVFRQRFPLNEMQVDRYNASGDVPEEQQADAPACVAAPVCPEAC